MSRKEGPGGGFSCCRTVRYMSVCNQQDARVFPRTLALFHKIANLGRGKGTLVADDALPFGRVLGARRLIVGGVHVVISRHGAASAIGCACARGDSGWKEPQCCVWEKCELGDEARVMETS